LLVILRMQIVHRSKLQRSKNSFHVYINLVALVAGSLSKSPAVQQQCQDFEAKLS